MELTFAPLALNAFKLHSASSRKLEAHEHQLI